jgi:hypothetical protein
VVDKFKKLKAPRNKTERDLKGRELAKQVNSRLKQSASRELSPLIFAQSLDPAESRANQKSFDKYSLSIDQHYKTTMNQHLQRMADFETRFNTNNVLSGDILGTPKVNPLSMEGSS